MAGDEAAALDTGDYQVNRGICVETTRYRYAGMETGDAQVGR